MTDPRPLFTMREWRDHMTAPVRMAAFAGAGLILAIMAPFGTDNASGLGRVIYWISVVIVTYSIGFAANTAANHLAQGSLFRAIALGGVLTGIGALAFIFVLNGVAFGYWPKGDALLGQMGNVMVISLIITGIFQIAEPPPQEPTAQTPPLLDRLPLDKRGALVSLSVEDHYVRVRTDAGEEMVLLRLTDAVREVGQTAGLRVHRSHWVALDQITAAARRGDGARLTMRHGPEIPVSRANVAALKEAGILPS